MLDIPFPFSLFKNYIFNVLLDGGVHVCACV